MSAPHIFSARINRLGNTQILVAGHAYVSHDWLCPADGFTFVAVNNLGVFTMGDSVPLAGSTRLTAHASISAKFKLICKGKVLQEETGARVTCQRSRARSVPSRSLAQFGRRGAALDLCQTQSTCARQVWPISRLPSADIASDVVVHKDIPYMTGNRKTRRSTN